MKIVIDKSHIDYMYTTPVRVLDEELLPLTLPMPPEGFVWLMDAEEEPVACVPRSRAAVMAAILNWVEEHAPSENDREEGITCGAKHV